MSPARFEMWWKSRRGSVRTVVEGSSWKIEKPCTLLVVRVRVIEDNHSKLESTPSERSIVAVRLYVNRASKNKE
jgi:hypothetical protein